jgi:hypothetical protein
MRRASTFWGAILLLAGALILLENLGLLAVDFWQLLWPGVIILFGIWFLWGATLGRKTLPAEAFQVPLEGADKLRLALHYGAGKLRVGPGGPSGTALDGSFEGGVEHRLDRNGTALDVDLRVPEDEVLNFIPWGSDHGLDWDIRLNDRVEVELNVEAARLGAVERVPIDLQDRSQRNQDPFLRSTPECEGGDQPGRGLRRTIDPFRSVGQHPHQERTVRHQNRPTAVS